jgi:peroxin-5
MLLRWFRSRFPEHAIPQETLDSVKNTAWASRDRLTDLFIAVARSQHAQGILDPDLQIGLGVLFYNQTDYDRAKDCFESALAQRPADYLLWNRYGSCLSNGNKPEEALGAYREALQLRPTYTRAIYNVAVACEFYCAFPLYHDATFCRHEHRCS